MKIQNVLFVQPHKQVLTEDLHNMGESLLAETTDGFARAVPSLPAMTVLGHLRNYNTNFIDCTADNSSNIFPLNRKVSLVGMSDQELSDKVSQFNPDVVLMTSMFSTEYQSVNEIASVIKKGFKVPIMVGGHHASLRPSWHLESRKIDAVYLGEGEVGIRNALEKLKRGDLENSKNIAYLDNQGVVRQNPKKIRLEDLNQEWDIEGVSINSSGKQRYPLRLTTRNPRLYLPKDFPFSGTGVLYFSRGCPYSCEYCNATNRDGNTIRHMSLDHMIGLTEEFIQNGATVFHNESDTFGIHHLDRTYLRWVGEQRDNERNLTLVNTNSFFARFFFPEGKFDSERADLLKKAGFQTVTVSIESFNPKFNRGKLRGITPEMLNECFSYMKSEGLNTDLYMMYLFPNQTNEELRNDQKLVEFLSPNLTEVTWRSLTYFPGTAYYDQALSEGKFTEDQYRELVKQGHSFYHRDNRFNFSKISNPPNLQNGN
jgi:radical SAM superfamily enzyme YgiQ (UPF0313 family)